MSKWILRGLFLWLLLFFTTPVIAAQDTSVIPRDNFVQAQVIRLQGKTLQATVETGPHKDQTVSVAYDTQSNPGIHLSSGDTIIIAQVTRIGQGQSKYYFVDQYRMVPLLFVVIGFFLFILLIAGWRGIGSIAGLLISLGIIFIYIVPQIIAGTDPLTVCVIGATFILFVTTFVAHGFSYKTVTALIATLIALAATFFIAQIVTHVTLLTGYGDQEAADLQFGLQKMIDLKGIFLGGIILATLGALNDITITQSAAIFSLSKANPNLPFVDLATEGFSIGREHALSLINTLLLAFAGASLTLFIFVFINPNQEPMWVILNSEFLVEEVIKIIAGTAGLLLAVPLVTLLAALVCNRGIRSSVGEFFK